VTLLAEFADLDTGVFVDDDESDLSRSVQLSPVDVAALRNGFDTFHQVDVESACFVVRTLSLLCCRGDRQRATSAVETYYRAYRDGVVPN